MSPTLYQHLADQVPAIAAALPMYMQWCWCIEKRRACRRQLGARGHQPRYPALAGRGAQRAPVQVAQPARALGRIRGVRRGRARPPPAQAHAPRAAGLRGFADLRGLMFVWCSRELRCEG